MPYWNNGVLPAIIESDIPQTSGGVDDYGNAVVADNFKTVKISKNTVNSLAWVNILIPVNAMNGDTKRQRTKTKRRRAKTKRCRSKSKRRRTKIKRTKRTKT